VVVVDLAHSATELLLAPLDRLPAWLELLVVSVLTGVIALLAVKYTTDQKKLERARDLMTSTIYEMRLFMDSPRRVLAAQRRLLLHSFGYVGRTLPALALLMLPLTLLFLHLELRFSYRAAPPRALVQVEVEEGASAADVRIDPRGRAAVLGPVVDPDANLAYFRIDLKDRAATSFDVALNGARTAKLLIADPNALVSSTSPMSRFRASQTQAVTDPQTRQAGCTVPEPRQSACARRARDRWSTSRSR
jgi:hypothetical protein